MIHLNLNHYFFTSLQKVEKGRPWKSFWLSEIIPGFARIEIHFIAIIKLGSTLDTVPYLASSLTR